MSAAWILERELDAALRGEIAQACRDAHFEAHFGSLSGAHDRPGSAADVVIGVLESGRRDIPGEVADAAEQTRAPLLLLCHDPLADGALALVFDQLELIAAPHSAERIARRLRTLSAPLPARPAARASERYGPRVWWAQVDPPAGEARFEMQAGPQGWQCSLIDADGEHELARCPSGKRLVRFTPATGRAGVWMCSPRRVPPVWELLPRTARAPVEIESVAGDAFVLHAGAAARTAIDWRSYARAASDGACALFEELRARAVPETLGSALLVAEVR